MSLSRSQNKQQDFSDEEEISDLVDLLTRPGTDSSTATVSSSGCSEFPNYPSIK
jgi:hypothetical protein